MADTDPVTVTQVDQERTLRLRQQVLRPNLRVEEVPLFGADRPDTATFGALDSTGEVVGCGLVQRETPPDGLLTDPDLNPEYASLPPWQLRAMATSPEMRSLGIGSKVLGSCVDYVAAKGGGLLWCNARIAAKRFYERAGFVSSGGEFVSQSVPHVVMWRTVMPKEASHDG